VCARVAVTLALYSTKSVVIAECLCLCVEGAPSSRECCYRSVHLVNTQQVYILGWDCFLSWDRSSQDFELCSNPVQLHSHPLVCCLCRTEAVQECESECNSVMLS